MAIVTLKDLSGIREKHKQQRIVYVSGTFDLTHVGHVLFFEDAKKQGDVLFVAVGDDASIRSYKGAQRPILNQEVRLKTVDAFKPVDFAMVGVSNRAPIAGEYELVDGKLLEPRALFEASGFFEVMHELQPDAWFVNEDGFDLEYRRKLALEVGMELIVAPRWCPEAFEAISTSKLIEKIKGLQ